jgi:hypothetical protein
MGGWMPYDRVRDRNGLSWRPTDEGQPYPGPLSPQIREGLHGLVGDLNRMERDYLAPPDAIARTSGDLDPSTACSRATGVPVETVRVVLAHVFARPHRGGT